MSIFGIIGITFLCSLVVFLVAVLTGFIIDECSSTYINNEPKFWIIISIVTLVAWIGFTFLGIGIADEDAKVWVQSYNAQKYTIEASLKNEDLTGLERIQLVQQAAELNGELATRKAAFDLWHHVHYDDTIYDGVELISLEVNYES